ncbi:3-deoxy-7-phosphoheptulonate synthase [Candidatus Peregrinibacteria bacterium]|nr:3-deoxy-7-phosphoheptulonate synthase [Candidatus Peregrinibacteria bacterium]
MKKHKTRLIKIGNNIVIGGKEIQIMAGPCTVETYEYTKKSAHACRIAGAKILRGGAFKLRTMPGTFKGLGEKGLKILRKVANEEKMAVISEVIDAKDIDLVSKYADVLQVGERNMQNTLLLEALGKAKKPVLLKRGKSAQISELLYAAEYIARNGNQNIILCERGIRTFENDTRATLALASVPLLKEMCDYPVIVDPSHATGKPSLVPPMAKAAIAAGADGLLIEVHPEPKKALCDGFQALIPVEFLKLMKELKLIAKAVGKKI